MERSLMRGRLGHRRVARCPVLVDGYVLEVARMRTLGSVKAEPNARRVEVLARSPEDIFRLVDVYAVLPGLYPPPDVDSTRYTVRPLVELSAAHRVCIRVLEPRPVRGATLR